MLLILLLVLTISQINSLLVDETCGYAVRFSAHIPDDPSNCPKSKPDVLNIHLVPHSHDDVGWLKTVDQYYYGTNNTIHRAGVQFILDSAIQALLLNHKRRFIYVETAFLWKWWQERPEETRDKVRRLIKTGQLEIVGGGWSMNDEATTNYQSTIDQFTWGFRKLGDMLGTCARPKIGWQIDPFGHSSEQASIFSQMGFDSVFFWRLDDRESDSRKDRKKAEFVWQGSQSLGESSQIFTSILFGSYTPPPGFCFDVLCSDVPINDNKTSPEYNAEERAKSFLEYVTVHSWSYKTNNILVPMGGDFHYQDALSYFANLDRLIKAVNQMHPNVHIFYSSPSCYTKAVNEANLSFTLKTGDFFPYASDDRKYWSGYFTSRPTIKRTERMGNNLLQVTKQLSALAFSNDFEATANLDPLREVMGVMQHHDAITGTEKQHVADDYAKILHEGMEHSSQLSSDSLRKLMANDNFKFNSCLLLNVSQCEASENSDHFMITVYNPLSQPITHYVRIPVSKPNYQIYDSHGNMLVMQVVPISQMITKMTGKESNAVAELIFKAEDLPPLGFKVFIAKYSPNYVAPIYDDRFHNKFNIKILSDPIEGVSLELNLPDFNLPIDGDQAFYYYNSRRSGAYIFRPDKRTAEIVTKKTAINLGANVGPHLWEFSTQFNDWIGRIIRIYSDKNYIEYQWIVGPIPVDSGKEVIARYSFSNPYFRTSFNSSKTFYTDSNGREMIKRIRDYRPFPFDATLEPVSQNYYPVTSKITLRDEVNNLQISVLNDRAQGGASLEDGQMELMLHRRLKYDDGFGVDEALNETPDGKGLVVTGKHYVTFGHINNENGPNQEVFDKLLAEQIRLPPWIFITPLEGINLEGIHLPLLEKSGLSKSLPSNINILTLEPWADNTILLRLEHILEATDDPRYSVPMTVDLNTIFSSFNVKSVKEMSLGGNILKSEVHRLKWKVDTKDNHVSEDQHEANTNNIITIKPMEIKTFIISV